MITITVSGARAAGKSTLAHHLSWYLKSKGHDVMLSRSVDDTDADLEALPHRHILITEVNLQR